MDFGVSIGLGKDGVPTGSSRLESLSRGPNPCLFSLSGFQPFGQWRLKIIEAAENKVPGLLAFAPPLAAAGSPSPQRPERGKCQGVGRRALGINIEGQSLRLGSWAKFLFYL